MQDAEPRVGESVGPYVVEGSLARGGMATVLAARDSRSGEARAIKLLLPARVTEEAAIRFRREFRILSRLHHPNVLRVFDSGMYGDRAWFAMERVQGHDLKAEVAEWEKSGLSPEDRSARAESIVVQVARALACIHAHGIIHRDVTPGNIMLEASGRVLLTDFGVVKEMGGAEYTVTGEVIGTVSYMAPEQFDGRSFDARADLYALGAVMYLMLTGRRPFSATSVRGYLHKHLTEMPRAPHEVVPQVPARLDAVCMRLLQKDPAARYASANHLLHALGARDESNARRWPPRAIVGRPLLRAQIQDTLEAAAAGRAGSAIVVRGEPGQGKTFLVDLAEQTAAGLPMKVARARCRPQDRPFGAMAAVFRSLGGSSESTLPPGGVRRSAPSSEASTERAYVPSHRFGASTEARPLDPGERDALLRAALFGEDDGPRERYPVLAALKELVLASAPCLIALEDLQCADPATAEAVAYLVRNTLELGKAPVVFLFSEDARRPSALARSLPVHRHVLGALGAPDVEELLVSILPDDPGARALAARLWTESSGSPGLLVDMLRALRDEGFVRQVEGLWRLAMGPEELAVAPLPLPPSLKEALAERLEPLSEDARVVARTLAIARRHVDLDVLVEAVALPEDVVMEAIDELEEEGIVIERRISDRTEVSLYHPRLRDVLLDGLPPVILAEMHRHLGDLLEQALEAGLGDPLEELAWHFEQGGDPGRAWRYLVQTAARHLRASLYEESLVFLERALGLEAAVPREHKDEAFERMRVDLHLHRATALHQLGRVDEAAAAGARAAEIAARSGDVRARSAAEALLGDLFRSRDLTLSEAHLRQALDLASAAGDPSLRPMPMYWLGAVRWQRGQLDEAHRLWRDALEAAVEVGDERAAAWVHNGLGIVEVCRGRTFEARREIERAAEMFERQGMTTPLHVVRYNLVEIYFSMGILNKALALSEVAIQRAREMSATQGLAVALGARTHVLVTMGRVDEARATGTECLSLVRQLGDKEDELHVRSNLSRVAMDLGEHEEALLLVETLGDLSTWTDSEGWVARTRARKAEALAHLGRFEEANAELASGVGALPSWLYVQVRVRLAWGRALKSLGRLDEAEVMLRQALVDAEKVRYRLYQSMAYKYLLDFAPELRRAHESIVKSLAGNLSPRDAAAFVARWGPD